jgi:hypothetical protein
LRDVLFEAGGGAGRHFEANDDADDHKSGRGGDAVEGHSVDT